MNSIVVVFLSNANQCENSLPFSTQKRCVFLRLFCTKTKLVTEDGYQQPKALTINNKKNYNTMSTTVNNNPGNRHHHTVLYRLIYKREKLRINNNFLTKCQQQRIPPNFTRFSTATLTKVNWSPSTIFKKRMEQLSSTILQNDNTIL